MKELFFTFSALSAIATMTTAIAFTAAPAQAGRVEPTAASCYFFRQEKLELKQTCIYESLSWAGGGFSTLTWKDGVKTTTSWGIEGRGSQVCPQKDQVRTDGICGKNYDRDPKTFKQLSPAESEKARSSGKVLYCAQIKQNSVCWKR